MRPERPEKLSRRFQGFPIQGDGQIPIFACTAGQPLPSAGVIQRKGHGQVSGLGIDDGARPVM